MSQFEAQTPTRAVAGQPTDGTRPSISQIGAGAEIGGYRVVDLLGRGGMSAVFLAEPVTGGDPVALKVLPAELSEDEAVRRRFLRESGYTRSAEHPNVVRVRESGEENGLLFIAMDLVEGTDLETLLAIEGAMEARRAIALLAQVAGALDSAHAAGLVHRDVKPGNVIVALEDGRERAYLTDFGLSKNPTHDSVALTEAGEFVGTYHYTAPEEIRGEDSDHRADVYGLGCLLYRCLCGQTPFPLELTGDVLRAHVDQSPPSACAVRPELPAALDFVIERALAKHPDERYGSCSELIDAARLALAGPAGETPETGPGEAEAGGPGAAPGPEAGEEDGAPGGPGSGDGGPRLRLKVTAGNATGTEIVVLDELLIGRHAEGTGQLEGDHELSRRHARIARTGGEFTIEDLGSTNGTLVNGRRIDAPELLTVGDELELGATRLVVQFSDPTPPPTPTVADAPPPAEVDPPPTVEAEPEPEPATVEPEPEPEPPPTVEAEPEPTVEAEPEPALEPEPGPTAEPEPAVPSEPADRTEPSEPALPPVAVRIELNPAAGEAILRLDDDSDSVRLVYEDGRWRLAPD